MKEQKKNVQFVNLNLKLRKVVKERKKVVQYLAQIHFLEVVINMETGKILMNIPQEVEALL